MGHWNKLSAQSKLKERKKPAITGAIPEQTKLQILERLREAIKNHCLTEPADVIQWIAEICRGTVAGDAALSALEMKGLLPDEFLQPSRRIRRDV